MQQGISLPPQVQGPSKGGSLDLIFGNLKWTSTSKPCPQHLFARITWWGDASATNHDAPLYPGDTSSASSIHFPLASSAAHIARYLNDMGVLEISILQVEMASKAIAKVAINTASIADSGLASFNEAVPVISLKTGSVLGSLQIKLYINYSRPHAQPSSSAAVSYSGNRSGQSGVETVGQEVAAALESLNLATSSSQKDGLLLSSAITHQDVHVIDTPAAESSLPASTAQVPVEEDHKKEKEKRHPVVQIAIQDNDDDDDDEEMVESTEKNATEPSTVNTDTQDASNFSYYSVVVNVESAFELPPASSQPQLPTQTTQHHAGASSSQLNLNSSDLVYASVVWQRDRSQRVNTHLTASQEIPLSTATEGDTKSSKNNRHAAVWHSQLELKVDIEPFLAVSNALSDSKTKNIGILDGPLLLINVWRSGLPNLDPMSLLEKVKLTPEMKETAVSSPFDQLIGCAAVDLSSFVHQTGSSREIKGKFPLVSAQHQLQGVVKASVKPNSNLTTALDALVGEITEESSLKGYSGSMHEVEGTSTRRTVPQTAGGAYDTKNTASTNNFGYTTRTIYSSQPGRKQEYAWSGSDSDDGDAGGMVGVSFEGAVSCSDHEDDDEEYLKGGKYGDEMDVEGEEKVRRLVTQDWMFDICKSGPTEGEEEEIKEKEKDSGRVDYTFYPQQEGEGEEYIVEEKRQIVFKNRLLPGVVMNTRQVNYLHATDFGGGGGGGASGGASSRHGVLPVVPQKNPHAAQPSRPTQISHHHPQLQGDWIFGIQQQQQTQPHQPQQIQGQSRRPLPPEVTANQFAPMTGNLPK